MATSVEDQEAIYRFRYRIYVKLMRRRQEHVDHRLRTVQEPLDDRGQIAFAMARGRVVATLRTNYLDDPAAEYYRRLYRSDLFEEVQLNRMTVTSKLMIAPEFRGTSLVLRLVAYMTRQLHYKEGVLFDLIDCNAPLVPFFERLGYDSHIGRALHREYGRVQPMFIALRDLEHLAARRSPLLRTALSLGCTQCQTSSRIREELMSEAVCPP